MRRRRRPRAGARRAARHRCTGRGRCVTGASDMADPFLASSIGETRDLSRRGGRRGCTRAGQQNHDVTRLEGLAPRGSGSAIGATRATQVDVLTGEPALLGRALPHRYIPILLPRPRALIRGEPLPAAGVPCLRGRCVRFGGRRSFGAGVRSSPPRPRPDGDHWSRRREALSPVVELAGEATDQRERPGARRERGDEADDALVGLSPVDRTRAQGARVVIQARGGGRAGLAHADEDLGLGRIAGGGRATPRRRPLRSPRRRASPRGGRTRRRSSSGAVGPGGDARPRGDAERGVALPEGAVHRRRARRTGSACGVGRGAARAVPVKKIGYEREGVEGDEVRPLRVDPGRSATASAPRRRGRARGG